jgi:hypothetical protein
VNSKDFAKGKHNYSKTMYNINQMIAGISLVEEIRSMLE